MNQPTLGLLEALRPPAGFRTQAALGTTYSADLLTCMAVLTTMDGADGEQVGYGRIEAYRALDRLRDKVRICYQAGRISQRDGTKYPSLALLDRIMVPVQVAGLGSFHPKVWIVRQLNTDNRERFVLVVSSRNITTSADWDLGIALVGTLEGKGPTLPRVQDLAKLVLALGNDSARLGSLGDLAAVRWQLPPQVRELDFDFQPGGGDEGLHAVWRRFPVKAKRVLLLSPFIDGRGVKEAAAKFRSVPIRRLVAGTNDLVEVSLGANRGDLITLDPRQLAPAQETSSDTEAIAIESEEELEPTRALHAKVIAIDDGRRATIVLGSNNLTRTGWCGGSTEAFVRLVGDVSLVAPLWDWAGRHASDFEPPVEGILPEPPLLEHLRDEFHRIGFRLEDRGAGPSLLTAAQAMQVPDGVTLTVARYTRPQDAVVLESGQVAVELPGCSLALRTRFVVCTLRHLDESASWVAMADLVPPVGDARDEELIARLLGFRDFLAYLQSISDDESVPGTPEGDDEDRNAPASHRHQSGVMDDVHLEDLLRRLVANGNGFAEMDGAIQRYGALIRKGPLSSVDEALLGELLAAWTAIREGFS